MALQAEQVFDSIFVVESLEAADSVKTGQELYASYLSPLGRQRGVHVAAPHVVQSREGLSHALQSIQNEVRERRLSPILQMEVHGSTTGITLTNRDRISWGELAALLRPINGASRNSLFVGASMCMGAWMFRLLKDDLLAQCPAWGFVGPVHTALPADLLAGFGEFYRNILYNQDTHAALRGLSNKLGEVAFLGSEVLLARFWQHLIRTASEQQGPGVAAVAQIRERLGLPTVADAGAASSIREAYTRHRTHYLWLDSFPDQDLRFPLRFDDLATVNLGFEGSE